MAAPFFHPSACLWFPVSLIPLTYHLIRLEETQSVSSAMDPLGVLLHPFPTREKDVPARHERKDVYGSKRWHGAAVTDEV